jgi:hydrogenase nickel incorporation protein HypA/HybF
MHEMTIAINVVDMITRMAAAEGSQRINEVELEIGALAGIMTDALTFCYEAASSDTMAAGSTLKLIGIPGRGRCRDCEQEFEVETFFTACPDCSGFHVEIIDGKELNIRSINVD